MDTTQIHWRPLGQLFVDRGLISQDELEEVLVEHHETGKRLGTILVSRGLVSRPELTSVLVDQLGMELTKESSRSTRRLSDSRSRRASNVAAPAPLSRPESATTHETSAQAGQRETLDELEQARAEVAAQAAELRSALDRVRSELERVEAAVAWFEYWSTTRESTGIPPERHAA